MSVAKGEQERVSLDLVVIQLGSQILALFHGLDDLGQSDQFAIKPGSEVLSASNSLLQFLVINDTTGLGINQQHSTGLQAALLHN
jgi:hypothetical protein